MLYSMYEIQSTIMWVIMACVQNYYDRVYRKSIFDSLVASFNEEERNLFLLWRFYSDMQFSLKTVI